MRLIPLSHSCLETIKNKSISQTVALGDIFLQKNGHSSFIFSTLFYFIFIFYRLTATDKVGMSEYC